MKSPPESRDQLEEKTDDCVKDRAMAADMRHESEDNGGRLFEAVDGRNNT